MTKKKDEAPPEDAGKGKEPEGECPSPPEDLAGALARMEKALLTLTETINQDRLQTLQQIAEVEQRILKKLPFFLR